MSSLARASRRLFARTNPGNPFMTRLNFARRNARSGILNAMRSRTLSLSRRRNTSSGRGVTTQFDRSLIYRKRRMPRRRRRRWRKFIRRINTVSEKDLGSRTVVRNNLVSSNITMVTTAAQEQGRLIVALYPGVSTIDHMNDVGEMATDTDLGLNGKALFHSGILDMTVRNISEHNPLQVTALNPSITLEIDVYEISVGTDLGQTGKAISLDTVFTEFQGDTGTIPGHTVGLASVNRGFTPWDMPSALSEYRLRIWKKTKYFLSENQTFTYQFRDPRRHVLDKQIMTSPGDNVRGLTKYFVMIFKPTPGYNYSDTLPDQYGISVGVTRKYFYKINESNQDFDAYQT